MYLLSLISSFMRWTSEQNSETLLRSQTILNTISIYCFFVSLFPILLQFLMSILEILSIKYLFSRIWNSNLFTTKLNFFRKEFCFRVWTIFSNYEHSICQAMFLICRIHFSLICNHLKLGTVFQSEEFFFSSVWATMK